MPIEVKSRFESDCHEVLDGLRVALIRLFASVDADPNVPQDIARRFKINKNLSWKVSRILSVANSFEAISHMPGSGGMQIIASKLQDAGADEAALLAFTDAVVAFDRMVEVHVNDRATLELVLDALAPNASDRLETSRKLAFRGNSGIWGVQARTRMTVVCMAPNPDDESLIDMVLISGYFGFRRIRSEVRWPLFRVHTWIEQGGEVRRLDVSREPVEGNGASSSPLNLMREFSTDPLPAIDSSRSGVEQRYMLQDGPVGNLGAFDFVFGDVIRGHVPRYRDEANPTGEHSTFISAPIENLIFDMVVHKDLDFALSPTAHTYGKDWEPSSTGGKQPLPMSDQVRDLSGRPPVVTTPLVPRYSEILDRAYERMNWNPADFRGVRLQSKFPAMDSTVVLRFPLPERP